MAALTRISIFSFAVAVCAVLGATACTGIDSVEPDSEDPVFTDTDGDGVADQVDLDGDGVVENHSAIADCIDWENGIIDWECIDEVLGGGDEPGGDQPGDPGDGNTSSQSCSTASNEKSVDCTNDGDGWSCTCYVDGAEVGTCEQLEDDACSIPGGCCFP